MSSSELPSETANNSARPVAPANPVTSQVGTQVPVEINRPEEQTREFFAAFIQAMYTSVVLCCIFLFIMPHYVVLAAVLIGVVFAWFWPALTSAPAPRVTRTVGVMAAIASGATMYGTGSLKGLVIVLGCVPLAAFIGEMLRGKERFHMVTSMGLTVLGAFIAASGSVWTVFSKLDRIYLALIVLVVGIIGSVPALFIRQRYVRIIVSVIFSAVFGMGYIYLMSAPVVEEQVLPFWYGVGQIMFAMGAACAFTGLINSLAIGSCRSYLRRSAVEPTNSAMISIGLIPVLLAAIPTFLAGTVYFGL